MTVRFLKTSTPPRAVFGLAILIFLRFWFGLNYSLAIPAWESYDEPFHFAYASQIATTGTLPTESDPELNSERIQPPLYYYFLAGALRFTSTDTSEFKYPAVNPYFYYGTAGRNFALHPNVLSPAEAQNEAALHLLRITSLLFSLLGIPFVYLAARLLWPGRIDFALAAAALFALWPQVLFNSSVVSNDGPAAVFGAVLTWQILRIHKDGQKSPWRLVACIVTLVVGAAVKLNLLLFIVPLLLVVLLSGSRRLVLLSVLVSAMFVGGLILFLRSLPSVLLPFFSASYEGDSAIEALIRRMADPSTYKFIGEALDYALNSSFGMFGWGNLPLPGWVNAVWIAGVLLGGIGLVVALVSGVRNRGHQPVRIYLHQILILLSIFGAIVGGALALSVFYLSIHLIPGRYLVPALSAVGLLLIVAWAALRARWLMQIAVVALVVLGALVPPLVIASAYRQPPEVDAATVPNAMIQELMPGALMLGYEIQPGAYYPGDEIGVDVYWKAAYPIRRQYTVRLEMYGPDGRGYGILDTFPGDGNYATTDWVPDRVFKDTYKLRIRNDFPAPNQGHLRVSLQPGAPYHIFAQFGEVPIHAREQPTPPLAVDQSALFGDHLLMRGMDLQLGQGRALTVTPLWQSMGQIATDGTVFLHLDCDSCEAPPITRQDGEPGLNSFFMHYWLPGELVAETYALTIPESLAAGRYPLHMGVYDPTSKGTSRWPASYRGKSADQLLVGWVTVAADGAITLERAYPSQ